MSRWGILGEVPYLRGIGVGNEQLVTNLTPWLSPLTPGPGG